MKAVGGFLVAFLAILVMPPFCALWVGAGIVGGIATWNWWGGNFWGGFWIAAVGLPLLYALIASVLPGGDWYVSSNPHKPNTANWYRHEEWEDRNRRKPVDRD